MHRSGTGAGDHQERDDQKAYEPYLKIRPGPQDRRDGVAAIRSGDNGTDSNEPPTIEVTSCAHLGAQCGSEVGGGRHGARRNPDCSPCRSRIGSGGKHGTCHMRRTKAQPTLPVEGDRRLRGLGTATMLTRGNRETPPGIFDGEMRTDGARQMCGSGSTVGLDLHDGRRTKSLGAGTAHGESLDHPRSMNIDGAASSVRAGRAGSPGNAKILATTYFPERLPSQYLRRWRA